MQNPQLRASNAEAAVNTILDPLAVALERGDRVELRSFGAFSVKLHEAR